MNRMHFVGTDHPHTLRCDSRRPQKDVPAAVFVAELVSQKTTPILVPTQNSEEAFFQSRGEKVEKNV
jgi:hypothetical protein